MRTRILSGAIVVAALAIAGCSSDTRESIKTDLQTAASEVGNAAGEAADDAAEAVARNIATQQGEEQFKNAGQELAGPLSCEATVQDGVAKIDIACTGTTKNGEAAALTGTTNELPGASVVTLDGHFVGTVSGNQLFETERLGG